MRFSSTAVAATVLGLLAAPADAARIDSEFQTSLRATPADEQVGAVLMLGDRLDAAALGSRLATLSDRQTRHQVGVELLRERAARTQGPLLEWLRNHEAVGKASKIRPLWVTNAVLVNANPDVLLALADRQDVAEVYPAFPIELIAPAVHHGIDPVQPAPDGGLSIEPGVDATNAPTLWDDGITGTGRLVSHLDTGVAGTHPAFASRWRGLRDGVTSEEAWFDPVTFTTFPFDSGSHGTHTLGTIAGREGNDVIGMAYGAEWITAGVIDRTFDISRTIADALLAFEWSVDPDGDAFTIEDVPDVVSNSWGISPFFHGVPKCDDTFWEAIENIEMLGTAVVFAAGNEGSGSESLRTPADAILGPTSVFSVAALQSNQTSIASFSSRGPSGCDSQSIKPEVSAQGDNVRSAFPGGSYGRLSGTSMAAPHVAGAVALLRQIDPNADAAQIKQLLMDTAVELGNPGPDNTFGHGRIDVAAAADALRATLPDVTIDALYTETRVDSGDPLEVLLQFANLRAGTATMTLEAVVTDAGGAVVLTLPSRTRNIVPGANNYASPQGARVPTGALPTGETLRLEVTLKDASGATVDASSFAFIVD